MRLQPRIPSPDELCHREDFKMARRELFHLLTLPNMRFNNTINHEGLTFNEWVAAANFGVVASRHIEGPIARLAWAKGEDPTCWAHAAQYTKHRPGEWIRLPANEYGRIYFVGEVKGERITCNPENTFYHRNVNRTVVDLHMPLPKLQTDN